MTTILLIIALLSPVTPVWAAPPKTQQEAGSVLYVTPIERTVKFPAALDHGAPAVERLSDQGLRALEIAPGIAITDFPIPPDAIEHAFRLGRQPIPASEFAIHVAEVRALIRQAELSPTAYRLLRLIPDLVPLSSYRWAVDGGSADIRVVITPPRRGDAGEWESNTTSPSRVPDADGLIFAGSPSQVFMHFTQRGELFAINNASAFMHELIHVARSLSGATARDHLVNGSRGLVVHRWLVGMEPVPIQVEEILTVGAESEVRAARTELLERGLFSRSQYPSITSDPYYGRSLVAVRKARARAHGGEAENLRQLEIARVHLRRLNPTENGINTELGVPVRSSYAGNRVFSRSTPTFRRALAKNSREAIREYAITHPEEGIWGAMASVAPGVTASDLTVDDLRDPRRSRRVVDVDEALTREMAANFAALGGAC